MQCFNELNVIIFFYLLSNTLLIEIFHQNFRREPYLDNMVLHSTYLVAKHKVIPMDLVAVDTIKERVYSFLSVTWAIMADVDIESEKYRSLGGARFTVGGLARILSKNFTI